MRFTIFKRYRLFRGAQFYWRLQAANNEIIAQSEGYNRLKDCQDTVSLIKREANDATVEYELE